jgi:3-oxoacyl-[acyl-carrier-protein] synthase III
VFCRYFKVVGGKDLTKPLDVQEGLISMARSAGIVATHFVLGGQTLSFEELERRFGSEAMKKVYSGSGIRNRRVAAAGVCGSDMAFQAAQELFQHHSIDPCSIDLLIFCTQSPDHWLPSTACILQERLGLPKSCACFDINLGCSQYVYGLAVAHSMMVAGLIRRALLLTGDTMSRLVHPQDRSVVPLLGDAGSATLLDSVDAGEGLLGFELGTDGAGHPYLILPAGGTRMPKSAQTAIEEKDQEGNVRTAEHLFMKGTAIFHFGITVVPQTIERILRKLGLEKDNIDLFLFHQANKYLLEYLFKKLKIPEERRHVFIEEVGNTSGSTLPLVLTDAWREGKIKPGSLVLLVSFGVGLSWGATVIRWPQKDMGPVPDSREKTGMP